MLFVEIYYAFMRLTKMCHEQYEKCWKQLKCNFMLPYKKTEWEKACMEVRSIPKKG